MNLKRLHIITILLFIVSISFGQNLRIEIFNKTDYDLDSVSVGDKYIGYIKKDSSVIILDCKEVTIQDGFLFGTADGIIKDKIRDTSLTGWCGVGVKKVTTGQFKSDIKVSENELGYKLFWDKHE